MSAILVLVMLFAAMIPGLSAYQNSFYNSSPTTYTSTTQTPEATPAPDPVDPTVDGTEWVAAFDQMYLDVLGKENTMEWMINAPEISYSSSIALAEGTFADVIEVRLYQMTSDLDEYWFTISMEADEIPATQLSEYEQYFYDIMQVAMLTHSPSLTTGKVRELMTTARDIMDQYKAGEDPEYDYVFEDDIYFSMSYYDTWNEYDCTLSFEME